MAVGHDLHDRADDREGTGKARIWPDGWTAVTADGMRTAQFEHTILVTDTGREILTLPSAEAGAAVRVEGDQSQA